VSAFTVHVARFSDLAARSSDDTRTLSVDEQARAARLRFDDARQAFVLGRGWLRFMLGNQLDLAPADLRFGYGPRGKPHLAHTTNLTFNLAHSGDLLVLVLAQGVTLGVDVEQVRPQPNLKRVAADYFSAVEQKALFALPQAEQLRAFYHIWTRKEAVIKATGDGFALPLTDFDVTHDDPPKLMRLPGQWQLHQLDLPAGYIGAVCVER